VIQTLFSRALKIGYIPFNLRWPRKRLLNKFERFRLTRQESR